MHEKAVQKDSHCHALIPDKFHLSTQICNSDENQRSKSRVPACRRCEQGPETQEKRYCKSAHTVFKNGIIHNIIINSVVIGYARSYARISLAHSITNWIALMNPFEFVSAGIRREKYMPTNWEANQLKRTASAKRGQNALTLKLLSSYSLATFRRRHFAQFLTTQFAGKLWDPKDVREESYFVASLSI